MIARLSGRCIHLDEDSLVVDVGGVGYLVKATTAVLQKAAADSTSVSVWVYTNVRDDAIQLFGFDTRPEQQLFEKLLSLQGVGPKVALSIVSSYSPADIVRAAEHEDVALFQSISGIGPKVARRIVTELQGKLDDIALTTSFAARVQSPEEATFYDARDALVGLGMSLADAEVALKETDDSAAVDVRIKQALKAVRS